MEKGIWEQAFSHKNLKRKPEDPPPKSFSVDSILDDLTFWNDWPMEQKEFSESQGEWEAAFSSRAAYTPRPRATSEDTPHPVDIQPIAPLPLELKPSTSAATSQGPFIDALPISREKTRTGPSLLVQLGDFLDRIWVNLHLNAMEQLPKTFLFCGATRGVGVTFISYHLALALALERNMKVLYVDANLYNPQKPSIIPDSTGNPGLASYFSGYRSLETLILQTQHKNLFALPSGVYKMAKLSNSMRGNPRSIKEFVDHCRTDFDATILDGQPVLEYPGTTALARVVDQTILVCKYGASIREISKLAIDKLIASRVSVAGMVLNERRYPIPDYLYKLLR